MGKMANWRHDQAAGNQMLVPAPTCDDIFDVVQPKIGYDPIDDRAL